MLLDDKMIKACEETLNLTCCKLCFIIQSLFLIKVKIHYNPFYVKEKTFFFFSIEKMGEITFNEDITIFLFFIWLRSC